MTPGFPLTRRGLVAAALLASAGVAAAQDGPLDRKSVV